MSKDQIWITANGAVAIIGAIIFWFLLKQFFAQSFNLFGLEKDLLKIVIFLSLALSFIMMPYALLAITKTSKKVIVVISIIAALTGVYFIQPIMPVFPIMLIGTVVTNLIFVRAIENGLINQLKFKPFGLISAASGRFLMLMALWVSIGSYFVASAQPPVPKVEIPDQVIDQMIDLFSKNQEPVNSEIAAEKTFQQAKPDLIKQLNDMGITDEEQIDLYLTEAESQYMEQVRNQSTQVSLPQNKLINQQIKGEVENILNGILTKYKRFLPIIYSVSIFALFSLVGRVLEIFGLGLTWIVFSTLIKFRILKIKEMQSIKEELSLG